MSTLTREEVITVYSNKKTNMDFFHCSYLLQLPSWISCFRKDIVWLEYTKNKKTQFFRTRPYYTFNFHWRYLITLALFIAKIVIPYFIFKNFVLIFMHVKTHDLVIFTVKIQKRRSDFLNIYFYITGLFNILNINLSTTLPSF